MPHLLLLETSSKNCSVALVDEHGILSKKAAAAEHFVHAEQLHVMLDELLAENGLTWKSIDAVAVGKGPGSYTGLRIGVSAAKGICFALNIPLIALETTQILASYAASTIEGSSIIIPMIDARRMEVYWSFYDGQGKRLSPDEAAIIDATSFSSFDAKHLVLVGDGVEKCIPCIDPQTRTLLTLPSAEMMHRLSLDAFAANQFEDLAYFEPFYLKDYTPGTSRKSLL